MRKYTWRDLNRLIGPGSEPISAQMGLDLDALQEVFPMFNGRSVSLELSKQDVIDWLLAAKNNKFISMDEVLRFEVSLHRMWR